MVLFISLPRIKRRARSIIGGRARLKTAHEREFARQYSKVQSIRRKLLANNGIKGREAKKILHAFALRKAASIVSNAKDQCSVLVAKELLKVLKNSVQKQGRGREKIKTTGEMITMLERTIRQKIAPENTVKGAINSAKARNADYLLQLKNRDTPTILVPKVAVSFVEKTLMEDLKEALGEKFEQIETEANSRRQGP